MNDIVTRANYDSSTDTTTIGRFQDVEPIIKEVKDLKEVTDGRGNTIRGYFAGRIPAIIVEQYLIKAGIKFDEFIRDDIHIKRIMNDPDYKQFRVFEGRI
jgi:hypothetical protein